MGVSIGRCSFHGSRPSRCNTHGRVTVYHNGDVRIKTISGGKNIWSGSGDVWVIFKNAQDAQKNEFKINGKVQICNDY